MARKKTSAGESVGQGWRDKLHLIEFSFEDELDVKEWVTSMKPEASLLLEELVDSGWSVRISPPKSGDDYWCTATAKSIGEGLDGHSFSVKYPDFETAIILCGYAIQCMVIPGKFTVDAPRSSRAWLTD